MAKGSSQPDTGVKVDWYGRFGRSLTSFLQRSIQEPADRDDISQEIFLRLLRVKSPELIRSPKAYLYTVAAHVLAEWRAKQRHGLLHSAEALEELHADDLAGLDLEQMADLRRMLQTLPAAYSSAIVLNWHYGMTYPEIAEALHVSERMVKRYIAKGYAALRVTVGAAQADQDE